MYDINKIKMIISDVDGVWTDGSIYKGKDNLELKKFSVSDGAAVALIRQAGMKLALISGRYSSATEERAAELKIEDVYNGTINKNPIADIPVIRNPNINIYLIRELFFFPICCTI